MKSVAIVHLCILPLVIAQLDVAVDDRKFSSLGKNFTSTPSPSLLTSLATREEIIRMLLSTLQKELRDEPKNETARHAVSYSRDAQIELIERYDRSLDHIQPISA